MFESQFVRTTMLKSLGYALFVVSICICTNVAVLRVFGRFHWHWVIADAMSGILTALVVHVSSYAHRGSIAKVNLCQAQSFHSKVQIGNAIQIITHVLDSCDHVADPEHQKCRAAARKELIRIKSALGKSPSPAIIYGSRDIAAGAD